MLRKILTRIGVFLAVIAILWGALLLTSLIKNEMIYDNMLKSAESYAGPKPFSFENGEKYNAIADNYADTILLNILWNMESDNPLISSLDTKYYDGEEFGENWGLYAAVNGHEPNTDYSRYWHGSVVFVRPLMMFTDVSGIKLIGFVIVCILAIAVCVLLIKGKNYFTAVAFVLSLLGVQVYNVRLSLEYISAFVISLIMCICFIIFERKGNEILVVLSVISGTMVAFFDFLTTETLSILLPLMLVFMIRIQDNRLGKLKDNLLFIVNCLLWWVLSYVMTFIVKWSLASVVTGENKFITAFSSAEVRLGGETENLSYFKQLLYAPLSNISTMFGGESRVDVMRIIIGLLVTIIVFIGMFYFFKGKKVNKDIIIISLIIGVIPYVRYIVLSNHSYLHEFFTYRAQAVTILSMCSAFWFNSEFFVVKPQKKKKNNGKSGLRNERR